MDPNHVVRFGLLVLVLQSSLPAPAYADGLPQPRLALVAADLRDPVLGMAGTSAVELVETPAPPVPRECTHRYMAGPAVGVVVGPGATVGGMFMVGAGSVDPFDTHQKTRRDRGLIAGGSGRTYSNRLHQMPRCPFVHCSHVAMARPCGSMASRGLPA